MNNIFIDSNIPDISFYIDKEEVIIFHKKLNSLLKFYTFSDVTAERVSAAIDQAMKDLDWSEGFDKIFTTQKYRKALMNVPNILIGEMK